MAQELRQQQTLTQTQTQTLTPQQLLVVRLLELPVTDLENRVRNEMLENGALEEAAPNECDGDENEDRKDENGDESEGYDDDPFASPSDGYEDQRADYASEDDIPDYLLYDRNEGSARPTMQINNSDSFYEKLIAQMGEYPLTEHQRLILEYLIGSLDSDGLLRKEIWTIIDELSIYHNVDATEEEIRECLKILQSFEPCGIGATSLSECLILQLRDSDYNSPYRDVEIRILQNHFYDFAHKRRARLMELYKLSEDEINRVYSDISHLNPQPGSGIDDSSSQAVQPVVPDFIVLQDDDGQLRVSLTRGDVPRLRVSQSYRDLVNDYANNKNKLTTDQKNAYIYTRQKVESARTFINAVEQRNTTLLHTMQAIVDFQEPFFREGDETLLRPMILKDVAKRTGLDSSTISRVSNSKYVETDYGVFPLRYFFNDSFVTKDGEEISKFAIKKALKELVDNEDKLNPLSDDALMKELQKQGFTIARRTIAKYREMMGIPVARMRK